MKFISILLVIALLAFLFATNPTNEDFATWYIAKAEDSLSEDASVLDQLVTAFTSHLAVAAHRDDYKFCSVFTYGDHKTLGIGLMFFPLDPIAEQADALIDAYADWVQTNVH